MKIGSMFKDLLTSFFSKPVTEQYPFERPEVAERFRGKLFYDPAKCTGCNLCSKDCPSDALEIVILDRAAKKFGMPMGPIELMDTVGLDVATGVSKVLSPFLGISIPEKLQGMIAAGKRGKKDGEGFYLWKDGRAQKPEVPSNYQAPADLEDRMILPFLNEAVACLHDGVVADAELLDAGVIFGTGFAPFRGGPIQHIRDTGADVLLARLKALQAKYGDRFAPRAGWDSPLLRESAQA